MHKRPAPVCPVSVSYTWVFIPLFSWLSCAPAPRFSTVRTTPNVEKKIPHQEPANQHTSVHGEVGNESSSNSLETSALKNSPNTSPGSFIQHGTAVWYGNEFNGRKTASGERFNMHKFTAAHRTLPFNTYVKVTNENNNTAVVVRINDRGPFSKKHVIDLSRAAAHKIGLDISGTAPVTIETAKEGDQ